MQARPIDFALMFSKAHKGTSERLGALQEELHREGHVDAAILVQAMRGEHMALANAFLELWKEAHDA